MARNYPDVPVNIGGEDLMAWRRGTPSWEVGPLHTYPLTMFLGVIAAFLSICYFWRRQKYSWEILQILLIIIVPTSILGARLWFVIWEGGWDNFFTFSGLSIHGGVFLSTVAASIFLYYRRHSVDYRTAFSIILPNVILGQVIGRWGNFDNHEVFGRAASSSDLDWMGALKSHMLISVDGITAAYRQPLFLYEFMANGGGYIVMVLIMLRKNWLKPGAVGALYLVWYGIVRFAMEPLRDPSDIMGEGTFRISVFVAGLSLAFGIIFFLYFQWFDVILRNFFLRKAAMHNNRFYRAMTVIFNAKEYERINPIKPRRFLVLWGYRDGAIGSRLVFWGPKTDYRRRFVFFGSIIENRQIIWIPSERQIIWGKADIRRGHISVTRKAVHFGLLLPDDVNLE